MRRGWWPKKWSSKQVSKHPCLNWNVIAFASSSWSISATNRQTVVSHFAYSKIKTICRHTKTTEKCESSKFSVSSTRTMLFDATSRHPCKEITLSSRMWRIACKRQIKACERELKHIYCAHIRYVTMRAPFVVCGKREQVFFVSYFNFYFCTIKRAHWCIGNAVK